MLKRHTFWLWLAVIFLFQTGLVHSIGLFISPTPDNEAERQMFDLMMNHKLDLGAGFHRSIWNLFIALSSCFTFLCLLSGMILAYLLKKKVAPDILQGIVRILLLVFGCCLIVMFFLTFLLPILLTGLCVLFLAIGLVLIPTTKQSPDGGRLPS